MVLLILITFYIINFSFIIKTQSCSIIKDILIHSCGEGKYYNSMKCICEECPSGLINENICYTKIESESENIKSIYGLNNSLECFYDNGTKVNCKDFICPNNYYITELDNEGDWLGYLMCANGTYIFSESDGNRADEGQYQLYKLGNENKQNSGINPQATSIVPNYNPNLVDYYNYSCLNGSYEKSCQYLANLCVLSLYYYRNRFCSSIDQLSNDLKRNGVITDHLLKFDGNTGSILEQIIEIETSFDSKDNEIHINLIDLYIAK